MNENQNLDLFDMENDLFLYQKTSVHDAVDAVLGVLGDICSNW